MSRPLPEKVHGNGDGRAYTTPGQDTEPFIRLDVIERIMGQHDIPPDVQRQVMLALGLVKSKASPVELVERKEDPTW